MTGVTGGTAMKMWAVGGGGRGHVVPCEHAFALGCAPASRGDQAGEGAVTVPGGGEAEEARAIVEVEPGAGDEVQAGAPGGLMCAHDPGQGVAIGECECPVPQLTGPFGHFLGVGGALQEREVAGDLEFGVGGFRRSPGNLTHAKTPCRNQRTTVPEPRVPSLNSQ